MKSVALPEVAKIVMGQSPPSSTYNTAGEGLPFFQGKADFGDLYPTMRMFCTEPKKVAEAGDILISVRAPVGPTNISPQKSCIGRGLAAIRSSKRLDSRYLLYFLRFYEPRLAEAGQGSTFSAVSRSDLEEVRVPFPPLPEQKRIAGVLAKADRLRRLRRYARELSDSYLQSVFLEMFGDPVRNPMGWECAVIRNLCDKVIDYRGRTPPYSDDGIPHITASCIRDFRIDWTQCRYVSEETFAAYMTRGLPEFGDVIFTTEAPMGETAIVNTQERFSLAQRLLLLRTDESRMDSYYLCTLLSHPRFLPKLRQYVTGSTVLGIRSVHFVSIRIPVPPLPLQQQFARIVHQFERLRAQQREAQRQAEHLFQTLLHEAFRGEL